MSTPIKSQGLSRIKVPSNGCMCTRFDWLFFSSLAVFILILGIVSLVVDQGLIPGGLEILPIDDTIEVDVEPGQSEFIDIEVVQNLVVCYTTQPVEAINEIDTTLTLRSRGGGLIQFNDDIAFENPNSLLCHLGERDETLVLEVNSVLGAGAVAIKSVSVQDTIEESVIFTTRMLVGDIFHTKLNLVGGVVYEVMAFSRTPVFNEFDSAIRIKDFNGLELTESFQSTLSEFTARSIFVPPEAGEFLLEVREVAISDQSFSIDVDLEILLIRRNDDIQTITLPDIQNVATFSSSVSVLKSTLFAFSVPSGTQVSIVFDFDAEAIDNLPDDINRVFGVPGNEMLSSILPGLSMRAYDRNSNFIVSRGRSDFTLDAQQRYNIYEEENRVFYIGEFSHVETRMDISTTDNDVDVLLDITRWHPDYNISSVEQFEESDILFDFTFDISVDVNVFEAGLADQFDLFPDCDIDPAKLTLGDGTCDPGIILFCRNEFFPGADTSTATLEEFSNICTCAEVLCESLISGADISNGLITFFSVLDFLFIIFSTVPILIYLGALFDLSYFGGLYLWIETSDVIKTFTLCFIFFISAIVFYSTKFVVNRYTNEIISIDDDFDITTIPNPADALTYNYYDNAFDLRNEFLNDEVVDYFEDFDLVDPNVVPDVTFQHLQNLINAKFISEGLLLFFAVIVFLDVSLVWIKSVRSTSLNREIQKRRVTLFTRIVLALELMLLIVILVLTVFIIRDEGGGFNAFPAYITFFLSLFIAFTYISARLRLNFYFNVLRLESDGEEYEIWTRIKFTSTIVIGALFGNALVEFYVIVTIKDVEDAIESENDIFALLLFLFQDICLFVGQIAIFYYLFKSYLNFRDSLFVETVVAPDEDIQDKEKDTALEETAKPSDAKMYSTDSQQSISQAL